MSLLQEGHASELSIADLLQCVEKRKWHGKSPPIAEFIYGSMYCGKTEELIKRARRAMIGGYPTQIFKPVIDDRYDGVNTVNSHAKAVLQASPVLKSREILENLEPDTLVVCVDEIQFLDIELVGVIKGLVKKNIRVITAGLLHDFKGDPFGIAPQILLSSQKVDQLTAICTECGGDAYYTQRLVDGKPARRDDPVILVGAEESYTARCFEHHEVLD